MARRLIAQDRYAFVLLQEAVDQVSEADARIAWQAAEYSDGADSRR